jgi:hypothetical protein
MAKVAFKENFIKAELLENQLLPSRSSALKMETVCFSEMLNLSTSPHGVSTQKANAAISGCKMHRTLKLS